MLRVIFNEKVPAVKLINSEVIVVQEFQISDGEMICEWQKKRVLINSVKSKGNFSMGVARKVLF